MGGKIKVSCERRRRQAGERERAASKPLRASPKQLLRPNNSSKQHLVSVLRPRLLGKRGKDYTRITPPQNKISFYLKASLPSSSPPPKKKYLLLHPKFLRALPAHFSALPHRTFYGLITTQFPALPQGPPFPPHRLHGLNFLASLSFSPSSTTSPSLAGKGGGGRRRNLPSRLSRRGRRRSNNSKSAEEAQNGQPGVPGCSAG